MADVRPRFLVPSQPVRRERRGPTARTVDASDRASAPASVPAERPAPAAQDRQRATLRAEPALSAGAAAPRSCLAFVSSTRDFRGGHRAGRGSSTARSAPRVAALAKDYASSESLGRFLHRRFQAEKPATRRGAAGGSARPAIHQDPSTQSLASTMSATSGASTARSSATTARLEQSDQLMAELAAVVCAAYGEVPRWLLDADAATVPAVERELNARMRECVDTHAAKCGRPAHGVENASDSAGHPDPNTAHQLWQLKAEAMPGLVAGGAEDGAREPLERLGMSSSQLMADFGLSEDALLETYRTLHVFLFGFNSAIRSVLGQTLPTLSSGADPVAEVSPRLWRAYFVLVDMMTSSCWGRRLEESQLAALGGAGKLLTESARELRKVQSEQRARVKVLHKEIKRLKAALSKADTDGRAQNGELERLRLREESLIASYQALMSSVTLRRFELDERLARGAQHLLSSHARCIPHRVCCVPGASKKGLEQAFGVSQMLDETRTSQLHMRRVMEAEQDAGIRKKSGT